jgi:hypothetical protein
VQKAAALYAVEDREAMADPTCSGDVCDIAAKLPMAFSLGFVLDSAAASAAGPEPQRRRDFISALDALSDWKGETLRHKAIISKISSSKEFP